MMTMMMKTSTDIFQKSPREKKSQKKKKWKKREVRE